MVDWNVFSINERVLLIHAGRCALLWLSMLWIPVDPCELRISHPQLLLPTACVSLLQFIQLWYNALSPTRVFYFSVWFYLFETFKDFWTFELFECFVADVTVADMRSAVRAALLCATWSIVMRCDTHVPRFRKAREQRLVRGGFLVRVLTNDLRFEIWWV